MCENINLYYDINNVCKRLDLYFLKMCILLINHAIINVYALLMSLPTKINTDR